MKASEASKILMDYISRHAQPGEKEHETIARLVSQDKQFQVMYGNYKRLFTDEQKARAK